MSLFNRIPLMRITYQMIALFMDNLWSTSMVRHQNRPDGPIYVLVADGDAVEQHQEPQQAHSPPPPAQVGLKHPVGPIPQTTPFFTLVTSLIDGPLVRMVEIQQQQDQRLSRLETKAAWIQDTLQSLDRSSTFTHSITLARASIFL